MSTRIIFAPRFSRAQVMPIVLQLRGIVLAGVAGTACHLAVAVRYTRKVCIGDRQALFATTGSGPLTRRSVPGGGSLFMIIGGR
jgi:hypothetical protein